MQQSIDDTRKCDTRRRVMRLTSLLIIVSSATTTKRRINGASGARYRPNWLGHGVKDTSPRAMAKYSDRNHSRRNATMPAPIIASRPMPKAQTESNDTIFGYQSGEKT